MKSLKLFAKSLKLRTFHPCCTLIFFLQGISNLFRGVLLENGLQNGPINRLEQIILCLEVLQSLVFQRLSLHFCQDNSACWFDKSSFHETPLFFGSQKVLHQHAPMVIVTIKAWNGWLHKSFRSHCGTLTCL